MGTTLPSPSRKKPQQTSSHSTGFLADSRWSSNHWRQVYCARLSRFEGIRNDQKLSARRRGTEDAHMTNTSSGPFSSLNCCWLVQHYDATAFCSKHGQSPSKFGCSSRCLSGTFGFHLLHVSVYCPGLETTCTFRTSSATLRCGN